MPIRRYYENPAVQKLYEEFLGEPLSEKSHKLLHTHYIPRSKKTMNGGTPIKVKVGQAQ